MASVPTRHVGRSVFADVMQFAVVTSDLTKTLALLDRTLGAGAFKCWDYQRPALLRTTLRGNAEPWRMRLAISWLGNTQIEVIQPTGGRSLYREYLDARGHDGVHHLLLERAGVSYAAATQLLRDAGYPVAQEGRVNVPIMLRRLTLPAFPSVLAAATTTFGYADTNRELGVGLEVSRFPPGLSPRMALRLGKPQSWYPPGATISAFERLPAGSLVRRASTFVVLTRDAEPILARYRRLFPSAGPVVTRRLETERGPATIRSATIRLKTTAIELVQPADGQSPLHRLLESRGEGLHVIGFLPRLPETGALADACRRRGLESELVSYDDGSRCLFAWHEDAPFAIQLALPAR